jgi:hypothetical protein
MLPMLAKRVDELPRANMDLRTEVGRVPRLEFQDFSAGCPTAWRVTAAGLGIYSARCDCQLRGRGRGGGR